MNKYFRKIVVDNIEYDWLYKKTYYDSYIYIYKIYYEINKYDTLTRKRRFVTKYDIQPFCEKDINAHDINITPSIASRFIKYKVGSGGYLITKKYLRQLKLKKIKEIYEE